MITRLARALWCVLALTLFVQASPAAAQIAGPSQNISTGTPRAPTSILGQTQDVDGDGNIARAYPYTLSGGTPIEYPNTTLSTSTTTSGGINVEGSQGASHPITGTWAGAITFQYNPTYTVASPTAGYVTQTDCVSRSGASISSGVITGNATVFCPNDGGPQRILFSTATSGAPVDTPWIVNPALVRGVPYEAPPALVSAMRVQFDGAGTQINLNAFTPLFSTVPGDTLNGVAYPNGGLGACSHIPDPGVGVTPAAASLYEQSGSLGLSQQYTSASSINPYGCDTSVTPNALTAKLGYDTPNARWYGWQVTLDAADFFHTTGYQTPPYGVLIIVRAMQPTGLNGPALCPWFAPNWLTNSRNLVNGGSGQSTYPLLLTGGFDEIDHAEFCLNAIAARTALSPVNFYSLTWHDWGYPSDGASAPLPGVTQAANGRQVQGQVIPFTQGDGKFHNWETLLTVNEVVWLVDEVEVARMLKPGLRMNAGKWTVHIDDAVFTTPTDTTQSVTTEIQYVKVLGCPDAKHCPYPVN